MQSALESKSKKLKNVLIMQGGGSKRTKFYALDKDKES